eukprot:6093673-Prymnesium_polylepis.1
MLHVGANVSAGETALERDERCRWRELPLSSDQVRAYRGPLPVPGGAVKAECTPPCRRVRRSRKANKTCARRLTVVHLRREFILGICLRCVRRCHRHGRGVGRLPSDGHG